MRSQSVQLLLVGHVRGGESLLGRAIELPARLIAELGKSHAVRVCRVLLDEDVVVLVVLAVALHARLARQQLAQLLLLQVPDGVGREQFAALLRARREQVHGQIALVLVGGGVAFLVGDLALVVELDVAAVEVA